VLANYTLGGADMLRRAMGKKKPEVMAEQRELFMKGAVARDVDAKLATFIFDLMEKFAGYGFNKSHSAAYALLSYQTAWLKTHYPAEFMAAVLSADMDNTDKVVGLIEDCHQQDVDVLPPDINHSIYQFSVHDEKSVLYGLGALKGVGEAALDGIIAERESNGEFVDLYDFCRRSDTRKVNRRVMEALIKSGAMDSLGHNRASLIASLSNAVQLAEQNQKNASVGQDDMFGSADVPDAHANVHIVEVDDWDDETRLINEKETLGLYLTGHPITRYEDELRRFIQCRFSKVPGLVPEGERAGAQGGSGGGYGRYGKKDKKQYVLAGLLIGMRVRKTKTGSKIVTGVLDDRTARVEVVLYEDVYEQYSHSLVKDKVCVVVGSVSYDDFNAAYSVNANTIYTMTQAREKFSRGLQIKLDRSKANGSWSDNTISQQLHEVLQAYREGSCPINIEYNSGTDISQFVLGEEWNVVPSDELLLRLENVFGAEHVEIMY
jgi:DNA polymerase-3 subunit alpha